MLKTGSTRIVYQSVLTASVLAAAIFLWQSASARAQEKERESADVIDIGSRRELFVDRLLIDRSDKAELRMHPPRREGRALEFVDKPWEGHLSGYVTVLKDGDSYRMYYRGLSLLKGGDGGTAEVTCLAESPDGITWTKPELGLFEFDGTRKNNIVLAGMHPYTHNFSPWIDTRPGVAASERYKSFSGLPPQGLALFVSPDGLRWTLKKQKVIAYPSYAFDSQACAFWSASEGKYVCYFRIFENENRWIARATSDDCLVWSKAESMSVGDTPREQFYTNMTQSYYRAPHIYIALAQRFFPKRSPLKGAAAELVPDAALRGFASDVALLSTRGGNRYDRTFLESYIRPGTTDRDWAGRNNTAAWGIVPASDDPDTMYLYRQGDVAQPTACVLRYSLRVDGFSSINAPYTGGELLTRPLIFAGKELELNYSTSAAGSIAVEIQNDDGQPLPGYGLTDCDEIFGDRIDGIVSWKGLTDVSALAGKPVRLRFVLRDADLFALKFRDK
jgi:hypothetical protein